MSFDEPTQQLRRPSVTTPTPGPLDQTGPAEPADAEATGVLPLDELLGPPEGAEADVAEPDVEAGSAPPATAEGTADIRPTETPAADDSWTAHVETADVETADVETADVRPAQTYAPRTYAPEPPAPTAAGPETATVGRDAALTPPRPARTPMPVVPVRSSDEASPDAARGPLAGSRLRTDAATALRGGSRRAQEWVRHGDNAVMLVTALVAILLLSTVAAVGS
jgi:hypothetical protein